MTIILRSKMTQIGLKSAQNEFEKDFDFEYISFFSFDISGVPER
jgi:hypothetical protein